MVNLTNQKEKSEKISKEIDNLKSNLDQRKEVWSKLNPDKKTNWINSNKDPIINLAFDTYKYLDKFFGGMNA